jgi:hypothetical protein
LRAADHGSSHRENHDAATSRSEDSRMSGQAKKKFRSKFFRVAVEGATTDGRVIERSWIADMAATYNPQTYGARIWVEHIRSMLPESPFRAYGDVTAVKAEEVEIDGKKRLALFAQIEPTDDLVNMVNNLKQKVFTSIEISPKFASSGKPYLVGLSVTDSPASLGTDMLSFAAQNAAANPFKARKQDPANLFTAAEENEVGLEEITVEPSAGDKLYNLIAGLAERLAGGSKPEPKNDPKPAETADFSGVADVLNGIAGHLQTQGQTLAQIQREFAEQGTKLQKLQADHAALQTQLSTTPAGTQPKRPAVTGNQNAGAVTDC